MFRQNFKKVYSWYEKQGLIGYNFSVGYDAIDVIDIVYINKYLIGKHIK